MVATARTLAQLALPLLALALTGCQSARFYRQAVAGQAQILFQRRSIDRLLNTDTTPEPLRRQLTQVRQLCAFAQTQLHLPARRQYTSYVDLQRPFVVWNVHAAPEFSVAPKTWRYPIVGQLEYQGYFRESLARHYGQALQRQGFDVAIGGVDAYSTLGWFNDPVLNTFVFLPDADLADLVFHELAHRRLFFRGDTEFNEAFATVVARAGVRRWLESTAPPGAVETYLEEQARDDRVIALILEARQKLESLYTLRHHDPPPRLRVAKREVLDALRRDYQAIKRDWPGYHHYDTWMQEGLNNATLNAVNSYHRCVPALERVLAGLDDDLPAFYATLERLKALTPAQRAATLEWIETTSRSLAP